jgi:transposase
VKPSWRTPVPLAGVGYGLSFVGAYVGLTSRRHASGEVDWTGRISKCGDAMLEVTCLKQPGFCADARAEMIRREGLGSKARQAQRAPQGKGRGRA